MIKHAWLVELWDGRCYWETRRRSAIYHVYDSSPGQHFVRDDEQYYTYQLFHWEHGTKYAKVWHVEAFLGRPL